MPPATRQSSALSVEAPNDDDSDSSDEDVSFAGMLIRIAKEKGEGEKDAGFLTDGDGDNDEEDSTDDYSDPGDAAAPAEDKEGAPTPAENAREKCVATGRKSVAQRSKMALKTAWVRPTKGIHPSSIRVAWGSTFRCRRRISRTPNGSKRVYLCTKR